MDRDPTLDVAVTGISTRLPGVDDLDDLWLALLAGRVLTTRMARADLLAAGVPRELVDDPDYVPVRGLLADADRFDHTLFRVSPREAEMMDPQHRLMLEASWRALEDAGQDPTSAVPATAVFASGSGSGYLRAMLASGPLDPATQDQAVHGTEPDFIAGLISYKLGLTGPAMAVQTACSSGLVSVHLAVQSLLNGDCDQAIVVAAGIDHPQAGHLHLPGGIQSRAGSCTPFDAAADGVVAGSGVVSVVLRRREDAEDAACTGGVQPYGLILGTAIGNDGPAKAGYYAPSVTGQETTIRAAYSAAGVGADTVGYLETHGTGTRVGDPIEWSAASSALTGLGAAPGRVAIGALKANTGHLDAAAGLAALVKALLVVRHGLVPPVAGFRELNPLLVSEGAPLSVPQEVAPWSGPSPRRAGVSSFGIGGTNAHVLIEQPPTAHRGLIPRAGRPELVLVSAATRDALDASVVRLGEYLRTDEPDPADVAKTLVTARATLAQRVAAVSTAGGSGAELADRLAAAPRRAVPAGGPVPLVFLFPGQGAQRPGMACPLDAALPGFAEALDTTVAAFARFAPALADRALAALRDPAFPAAELDATDLAQPALFALGHAAALALGELGLTPAALAGHSLGEITAACVAGILDVASAARLVTERGRAMADCPPGAMLALGCDEDEARALLVEADAQAEVAATNGPTSTTVAGTGEAVDELVVRLGDRVAARRLRTDRAFHSVLIEPALPALARTLERLSAAPPRLPVVANATGRLVEPGTDVDVGVFVDSARRPVRFGAGLAAIARRLPGAVALEVGTGRVLSPLAETAGLDAVPLSPARTDRPADEVLTALGALWSIGQPLDVGRLACRADASVLRMPGYVFHGSRWLAPEVAASSAAPSTRPAAPREGREAGPGDVRAPARETKEVVSALWGEVLGAGDLTESSDFFELGGDSLLVTHLVRRINRELGVEVPMREMLAGRTLGRQTRIVRDAVAAVNA